MGETNLEDMMDRENLEIIMVTIFFSIGFWFLVASSLSAFVKTIIKVLILYKKFEVFGRLSTADFEENWFEIILANNKIMRIYTTEIKTRKMKFSSGFVFCQVKYNLLKLRWEHSGLHLGIAGKNMNDPIDGGYFERKDNE